ncbi:MAG: RdgB/HAM1 family non-canonical purine NTP pyrophosphatase [Marinobacter sp.]|nr:RdgB/HAM1 family non-canonical purine NTP pyrophosphatase [Marinobacter sp.]
MSDNRLVLASNNQGKLAELGDLLAPLGLQLVAQRELGVPEAEEPAITFVENALIKARHAAALTGLPALADDSGLAVDALGGQPGVRSARFAGPDASDQDNIKALLTALADVPDSERRAWFHCVLVFLRSADDPTPLICHGRWQGEILRAPRGDGGFGYDPVFWVPETGCAAAELSRSEKSALSHRGKALQSLRSELAAVLGFS